MNPIFNVSVLHAKLYVLNITEVRKSKLEESFLTYILVCLLFQVLLLPASPATLPTPHSCTRSNTGFLPLIIANGSYAFILLEGPPPFFHKGLQSCPPRWTLLPNP